MLLRNIKLKAVICLCFLTAATISCLAQKIIKVDSAKVTTLRIDPSNAVGGNVSDFFSEISYIPLETTNESLFGSIAKLEVTDDYYIILDNNTHSILIFTKAGKFHSKIKSSEGQDNEIGNFSVNKWAKQIIFSRDGYKTLTYCDYNGKVIRTEKINENAAKDEIYTADINFFSADQAITDNYYSDLDSTSKDYKTYSKSLLLYTNLTHKVYAQGLPFTKAEGQLEVFTTGLGPMTSFSADTSFFYSKLYDYAIYTISPNKINFSYKFIFPLNISLPNDILSNTAYNKKRFEWFQKHPNAIFCLSNFFRVSDNILFRLASWSDSKQDNLIYNLNSGSLIAYRYILQDEKSHFLPICDQTGRTFNDTGLLACRNGYLFTSISSLGMFKAYEENADRKVKYPPILSEYFKSSNKKNNPVLVLLKLKNNL